MRLTTMLKNLPKKKSSKVVVTNVEPTYLEMICEKENTLNELKMLFNYLKSTQACVDGDERICESYEINKPTKYIKVIGNVDRLLKQLKDSGFISSENFDYEKIKNDYGKHS